MKLLYLQSLSPMPVRRGGQREPGRSILQGERVAITLRPNGFTLLEMSIVIMVLISLLSVGLYVGNKTDEWRYGREASEALRAVYAAQRLYLSDFPTRPVSALTAAELIPYLPNSATAMPTIRNAEGQVISILVNVSPPVASASAGAVYDPSGSSRDSLWDVGQ